MPLVVPNPLQVTTLAGQTFQPKVVARFDGPLPAPIVKGTKLGTAAVSLPDGRAVEYPLEAGADVPAHGHVRPHLHARALLPGRLAVVSDGPGRFITPWKAVRAQANPRRSPASRTG